MSKLCCILLKTDAVVIVTNFYNKYIIENNNLDKDIKFEVEQKVKIILIDKENIDE